MSVLENIYLFSTTDCILPDY